MLYDIYPSLSDLLNSVWKFYKEEQEINLEVLLKDLGETASE